MDCNGKGSSELSKINSQHEMETSKNITKQRMPHIFSRKGERDCSMSAMMQHCIRSRPRALEASAGGNEKGENNIENELETERCKAKSVGKKARSRAHLRTSLPQTCRSCRILINGIRNGSSPPVATRNEGE